jgi:alanyl-tRNA synthetase
MRELGKLKKQGLTGNELFMLQDTYGFPLELSIEEADRQNIELSSDWRAEFDAALEKQRETSRTASKGMFKGGLEDGDEMTLRYHTAAHLMLAAMHEVLGSEVEQRGSNITADRLRFDFSWDDKLTEDQVARIEERVNRWIEADLAVSYGEFDTDYALGELSAHGSFREKYGDKVTVYTVGEGDEAVSKEICGGPHVDRTGVIGEGGKKFRISKQEASSAGVRRVKGILE